MARPLVKGHAVPDLRKLIDKGVALELSAIPIGDNHVVYFRQSGTVFWHLVMDRRKEAPITYKTEFIGRLLSKIRAEFPELPLMFRHAGTTFFSGRAACALLSNITEQFALLPVNKQRSVLSLLSVPLDATDPAWELLVALTYRQPRLSGIDLALVGNLLFLPPDWFHDHGIISPN